MGVNFTIGGRRVQPESYQISESSTPLAGGDSSGAIGTIEADLPRLPYAPIGLNANEQFSVVDTALGSTIGQVREVSDNRSAGARYSVMASNRLGEFNIEAQVQPYTGTLEGAFRYYCSLANIDTGIVVDPAIANRAVNFLGWNGNLWNHMKMMATAVSADLNLISNNVVLRPVRLFDAIRRRDVEARAGISTTDLARKQEVIWYRTENVTRGLVYPSGGWRSDVTPLTVTPGETVEKVLDDNDDVHASIFSIEQPVAQSFVSQDHSSSSVYSVVGDDGFPIPPQQWADYGGRLSVRIGEDTRSLVVTIVGATGLFQANGEPMKTFRIGISSGTSASDTYSTLRIVGRYISVTPQTIVLPTGVADFRTGQEFAPTIDNPFLNSLNAAYSAGIRGARRYAGRRMTVSASVTALNRRGNTGTANYPPYSRAQSMWGGMTYGQVQALRGGGSSTPWVEQRRNLQINPRVANNASGSLSGFYAGGNASLTSVAGAGAFGNTFGRAVATAAGAFAANASTATPNKVVVTPGEVYTFSVYVRGTVTRTVHFRVQFTGASSISSDPVQLTAGWNRISFTVTVPAGASDMRGDIYSKSDPYNSGDYFDWSAYLIEKSSDLLPYFDGSFLSTSTEEYSWGSTENSSVSILRTRTVSGRMTYRQTRDYLYSLVQDTFDNQVFGNAPGARYFDRESGRYYRIRQATTSWGGMQVEGDDDLTNGDMQRFFQGQTYAAVKARFAGQSYYKANVRGML